MPPMRETPPPPAGIDDHRQHVETSTESERPIPPTDDRDANSRHGRGLHPAVATAIVICCLLFVVQVVGGLFALGSVTVGVASCAASISDAPIAESAEVTEFIENRRSTDYDLATFDALRGALDSLYQSKQDQPEVPYYIENLRKHVAEGMWPERLHGYGDIDSPTNPQLWVRLAVLAREWLTRETGEYWRVVDFAYPFPSNGSIPWPARRDEYDTVKTLLVCTEGDDEGLYVTVDYYRWAKPPRYESDLAWARSEHETSAQTIAAIRGHESLIERPLLLDGSYLYIWETDEDDALRSPDTFCALANEVAPLLGSYASVTLVSKDTPCVLSYDPLSYDYPNRRDDEELSFEEAQERLALSAYYWTFWSPWDQELLSADFWGEDALTTGQLKGTLIEDTQIPSGTSTEAAPDETPEAPSETEPGTSSETAPGTSEETAPGAPSGTSSETAPEEPQAT